MDPFTDKTLKILVNLKRESDEIEDLIKAESSSEAIQLLKLLQGQNEIKRHLVALSMALDEKLQR